ncbi:MAG: hypothetical protein GF383_12925 [Candidatus Lokiarchaeota archaeon]|nr:hypothetical protein [Candidatus Lokiarchaeota archaeon]
MKYKHHINKRVRVLSSSTMTVAEATVCYFPRIANAVVLTTYSSLTSGFGMFPAL